MCLHTSSRFVGKTTGVVPEFNKLLHFSACLTICLDFLAKNWRGIPFASGKANTVDLHVPQAFGVNIVQMGTVMDNSPRINALIKKQRFLKFGDSFGVLFDSQGKV